MRSWKTQIHQRYFHSPLVKWNRFQFCSFHIFLPLILVAFHNRIILFIWYQIGRIQRWRYNWYMLQWKWWWHMWWRWRWKWWWHINLQWKWCHCWWVYHWSNYNWFSNNCDIHGFFVVTLDLCRDVKGTIDFLCCFISGFRLRRCR